MPSVISQPLAEQAKNSQYENTVIDFVRGEHGCFIVVTDDQAFLSVLRTVLNKYLGLAQANLLRIEHSLVHTLKAVADADKAGHAPILLLERTLDGQDSTLTVKQLKATFSKLLVIILTVEISKERIMYLHEVGADNFIAKPISANTLVEKLAFTIKPQNKLGQLIDEAKARLLEGKPEKAKESAAVILEIKPRSPAGLMVLGDAELALGNAAAAKKAYREASDNADLYLEPLRRLANLAEQTGALEECLEYLEKLNRLSPLNSERKVDMGKINLDLGHEEQAQRLFEEAIDRVAKDSMDRIGELAERIATIYADSDPERSETFLRKALDIKKKRLTREDIRVFNRLGINLRRQGKWQEAIEEYKRALKIVPDDEHLHYNLGLAYMDGKVYREALACMKKALKLNEKLPDSSALVAYRMGMAFLQGADKKNAVFCLKAALRQQPDMKNAKEALARLGENAG